MANTLEDQLNAYGTAQVIVVLKDAQRVAPAGKPAAALAAAIPVRESRATAANAEPVVMQLSKFFKISETSADSALAAAAKSRKISAAAGLSWYEHAKSASNPTPPARFYPNLGLMLGTVDRQGVQALQAHGQVAQILVPPILSLIRPTAVAAVKPKKQYTWGIKRLKVDKLHKQGITGEGIIVGHLDTGADGKHPALKAAFHAFAEFDDFGFEKTPAPKPWDSDEHGTHTAGTIAGRTRAGYAIGVAPKAKLASAMVIEGGNAIARVLAGMDWVIGQGCRILSMSLGFRGYTDDFLILTQTLRARGVLPVFAVGNEGPGTSRSPGNYAEALSIGASGSNDKVASFSSSREFARPADPRVPDLVAPGVGTISAKPGGGYQQMDGTSMATPHIAGLAALLFQHKPAATIDQVEKAILDSCTLLPGESAQRQNRGIPDAVKALALL